MRGWRDYELTIGMPHMVPNKLSEVELLKWLGAYQWESISALLGRKSHEITSLEKDRLYASFISVELGFPASRPIDAFEEGAKVSVRNRVGVFGRRFVEGMLLFDCEEIPAAVTEAVVTKDDLARSERPWAYVTNAFIARAGSNTKLKIFEPEGMDAAHVPALKSAPVGISEHQSVQASGQMGADAIPAGARPVLPAGASAEIVYKISPESDLNGAALLYFARYVAMMDYGTRRFMSEHLSRPVSSSLIECLSTEHRRIYYFVNAEPSDSVRIFVQAWSLPAAPRTAHSKHGRSSLARFVFRLDLYRASDGALMASSLVTKSLNVPDRDKTLVNEAKRFVASLERDP
ncbi:MAG TPA: LnmK family bifunctional acyltransferase/decarboxylase [Labilithrix sp.]|nr:LnmK family bifunctional acyltransferase/decarboxylase [Labilithrix sp.]